MVLLFQVITEMYWPNISSCIQRVLSDKPVTTVGRMKYPWNKGHKVWGFKRKKKKSHNLYTCQCLNYKDKEEQTRSSWGLCSRALEIPWSPSEQSLGIRRPAFHNLGQSHLKRRMKVNSMQRSVTLYKQFTPHKWPEFPPPLSISLCDRGMSNKLSNVLEGNDTCLSSCRWS